MKIGACYIRVSTDGQTEFSPDAQLKDIKKYAEANGIVILPEFIYIEEGITGKSVEKREKFKSMIATAKSKPKPFDILLVHAYDRFARNVKESRIYKELLRNDLGIEVISITEDYGKDKNAFLLEGLKDVLNEYYSLNLRDEVLKGMKEKASRGGLQCSAPFGYKVINNKLVQEEDEAKIVKYLFSAYANKEKNLMQLTKYINELGFKTKRGNKFENRTIKYMLNNPVYKGYLRWSPNGKQKYGLTNYSKKDIIIQKGDFEPIITEEVFEKVHINLTSNLPENKKYARNDGGEIWHWLKGLIRCESCNCTYIKHDKGSSLRCNGYNKGRCNNNKRLYVSDLEKIILKQLKNDFENQKIELNIVPQIKNDMDDSLMIKKRISTLENSMQRIKEAYQSGVDTLEEYKNNKHAIQSELISLKEKLNKNNDNIKPQKRRKEIKNLYEILTDPTKSMKVKYTAIHLIISHIYYNNVDNKLTMFYY